MTSQDAVTDPSPVAPRYAIGVNAETNRKAWLTLVAGALIFLVIVFGVSRVGAERGNQVRFGFPDNVAGIKLASPDRAPEARGRTIRARYDRPGDGNAGLVVEWLPDARRSEVALGATDLDASGQVRCATTPQVLCMEAKKKGWLRFSQPDAAVGQVREAAEAFLRGIKTPDSPS